MTPERDVYRNITHILKEFRVARPTHTHTHTAINTHTHRLTQIDTHTLTHTHTHTHTHINGLLYFAKSDILRNLNEIDILRNYDEGKLYFAKLRY